MARTWFCVVVVTLLAGLVVTVPAASADTGGKVTVWDTSGKRPRPCPAIDASDQLDIRGGCLVDMFSSEFEITIRGLIGDMYFATCSYEHDMRIDSTGRTYLVTIDSGGARPCSDLGPCDFRKERPWRGQIEALPGGALKHVVDACLDTCMGIFSGKLTVELRRVGGTWRQVAENALVGDSGYRFDDGSWRIGGDIDIRPVDSTGGKAAAGIWRLTGEPVGWPI